MKKLILSASVSVVIGVLVGIYLSTHLDYSIVSRFSTGLKSQIESLLSSDTISLDRESLSQEAYRIGQVGIAPTYKATTMTPPDLFSSVQQSVVQVSDSDEQNQFNTRIGSGFVYDTNGHIITNNHVIANSPSKVVDVTFLDGTVYKAKIIGTDPFSDLAVLYVQDVPKNKLHPLPIGNSGTLLV